MNQDEIKTNLLDVDQWIRMLFMALFAVGAWFILLGLIVLVLVQTLIILVSGEPNRNLQKVGYLFGCYLQEIIQFLVYNTNKKPFPFADFPSAEAADKDTASNSTAETVKPAAAAEDRQDPVTRDSFAQAPAADSVSTVQDVSDENDEHGDNPQDPDLR